MIIDGTNISSYGFQLLRVDGFLDLPKRKNTTKEIGFEQTDIVFGVRRLTVQLIGKFNDTASMVSGVVALKNELMKGKIPFSFSDHGLNIEGWCERGMKVDLHRNAAHCSFEISYNNELEN